MTYRRLLCRVAITLFGLSLVAVPAAAGGPKAVIELFTSQGCSRCPPADALLAEYAARPDVIALSLPVDYWNYLGWEDTLASHANTERQRGYAGARGDRQVYTPQAVIDGRLHVVGSDREAIDAAIASLPEALPVPVSLAYSDDSVTVRVGDAPMGTPLRGTLWLALVDRSHTVEIGKGENDGRTVTYTHVVREMRRLAMWKGQPMSVDLPLVELRESKADGCAILLQRETAAGQPGAILGAAMHMRRQ